MAPAGLSLRCANFAKHSYQSPTQCIGTLAAIVPVEFLQLCGAVPSSGVRTRTPALTGLQSSPERLVPDSTCLCAPVGIDPHARTRRPRIDSAPRTIERYSAGNRAAPPSTNTPLSDLCPRGWLTFSRSLSNETTNSKQLTEAII